MQCVNIEVSYRCLLIIITLKTHKQDEGSYVYSLNQRKTNTKYQLSESVVLTVVKLLTGFLGGDAV